MASVDQALSLLWQAARPSPHLREAVELVESEIHRLRAVELEWERSKVVQVFLVGAETEAHVFDGASHGD